MQQFEITLASDPRARKAIFSRLAGHAIRVIGGKQNLVIEATEATANALAASLTGRATVSKVRV